MEATSVWASLQEASSQPEEGGLGLRAWLQDKTDLTLYKPEAAPGVVLSRLMGREGEYYVLKNPDTKTYYRLSGRDFFLWQRMDGTRTLKDLVVAYFIEHGSFAFARAAGLVQGLKASYLLKERPSNVYQRVRGQLQERRPGHRLAQIWSAFLQKPFAISGLDRFVAISYRWGGRFLFTRPLQFLFLVTSALGLYAFIQAFSTGGYGLVTIAGSARLGIAGLILANLLAVFLHEMAHALTVKHYRREVRRGGFMIYFGMPAFFVDTTDIWLEGKGARLAVTWAGPYSGLILGGMAGLILVLWPAFGLNPLLFQFAFLSYVSVFLNLNPLLELDGYYLLMDWLEIPMLRRKSLEFIRRGVWDRVTATREAGEGKRGMLTSFSREERIFTVFGLLSAAWTAYALFMGVYFWQQRLAGALGDLWTGAGGVAKIVLSLGIATIGLLFVVSIGLALLRAARKAVGWAARHGLLENSWILAAVILVVASVLALVPANLGYELWHPVISVAALVAATIFAWRCALDYAGSRLAPVFWLLGLFALSLLLGLAATLGASRLPPSAAFAAPLATALGYAASIALVLAGLTSFSDTDLGELHRVEKLLLTLGLSATYGLVLWQAGRSLPLRASGDGALLTLFWALAAMLALTLLVPSLASFWRTAFGPAWAMMALSLGALVVVTLLDLSPLSSYLLLAGAFILHHLAYRRVTFAKDGQEASQDLSDEHRLQRAFSRSVATLLAQVRQIAGERPTRVLRERFNNYALAAGWPVGAGADRVEEFQPGGASLLECGEVYAAALGLLLDLIAREVGEKLAERALQRAYDGLPWEEREIATQYLFSEVDRAKALGREFQSTREEFTGLLRRMPLFATMDSAEIDLLCSRLRAEQFAPRKVIIRQGEPGDRFYIVRRGHVEVTVRNNRGVSEVVNQLGRGAYFGEVALLQDARRNATCSAIVPSEVLSLSRKDFEQLVRGRFALRETVERSIFRADLLRRMPLFAELGAQQIQLVAAQLREELFEPGATIVRQGEIGETFYVIEKGRVQVSLNQHGKERVVTQRGPGEYVGEIALLLSVPRTATVKALAPTRMLVLDQGDFLRLSADHLCVSRGLELDSSRRVIDLRRVA
jgi:putative peptide zinc metalloprotease protein